MIMDAATAWSTLPGLVDGALSTAALTLATLALGLLVAVPVALCRNARSRAARTFAIGFVFVFRGSPLLALLFMIYYGAPDIPGLKESPAWVLLREPLFCAVLALSLNSAGYLVEILAGAMRAVPRGEVEAAAAAGFSPFGILRRVMVPHAARIAVRAYGNEVIFVIKATSVASLVTVAELLGSASKIYFNTFDPVTPFAAAGLIYLAFVYLVLRAVGWAEGRLTPERRARQRANLRAKTSGAGRPVLAPVSSDAAPKRLGAS